MPSNNRNAITGLPSLAELKKLFEQLSDLVLDYRKWEKEEKLRSDPNSMLARLTAMPSLFPLAPRIFSEDEAKAAWNKIYELQAYKKLSKHIKFTDAWNSFKRTIQPSSAQKARFLAGVAFYIHRFRLETEKPELIKQPLARTRDSAVATARKLRNLAKEGARLENLQDQRSLDTLLTRLASEMDKKPEKRPKNDETLVSRLFVKRLALDFLLLFDEPLTSVVSNLAEVVGYAPDQTNIDAVVGQARSEHEKKYGKKQSNALAEGFRKKALLSRR